jgi:hypothetical protein
MRLLLAEEDAGSVAASVVADFTGTAARLGR